MMEVIFYPTTTNWVSVEPHLGKIKTIARAKHYRKRNPKLSRKLMSIAGNIVIPKISWDPGKVWCL